MAAALAAGAGAGPGAGAAPLLRITAECGRSRARAGELLLPHGPVPCPVFMPVGTRGTAKGVTAAQLAALGCRICLGNTFHLGTRPVSGGTGGAPGGTHRGAAGAGTGRPGEATPLCAKSLLKAPRKPRPWRPRLLHRDGPAPLSINVP